MMRYVILAILIYLVYLVVKAIISRDAKQKQSEPKKRPYDVNKIQEAEFREVKKD